MLKIDIDKFVKSALNKYRPAYKEEIWNSLESRLDALDKPARRFPPVWSWAAMLVIALGIGCSGYYLGRHDARLTTDSVPATETITSSGKVSGSPSQHIEKQVVTSNKVSTASVDESNTNPGAAKVQSGNSSLSWQSFIKSKNIISEQNKEISKQNSSAFVLDNDNIPDIKEKLGLAEIPAMYASKEKNISADASYLRFSGKPNSMDIAENNKKLPASKSVSWQNILYNLWDNPAYAGSQAKYNADARGRFLAFSNSAQPVTDYSFSFDTRLDKLKSGVGVFATHSITPNIAINTIGLAYSFNIKLGPATNLRLGAGGTYSETRWYEVTHYTFSNTVKDLGPQTAFIYKNNDVSSQYASAGTYGLDAGLWFEHKNWISSFSVKNINQPVYAERTVLPHYILTSGCRTHLGQNLQIFPSVEAHYINEQYRGALNVLLSYRDVIMTGFTYQNINPSTQYGDLSLYAGTMVKNKLRLFVSYGLNSDKIEPGTQHKLLQGGARLQLGR